MVWMACINMTRLTYCLRQCGLWPADRCGFIVSRQLAYVNNKIAPLCVGSITLYVTQSGDRDCEGDLLVHRLCSNAVSTLRPNIVAESSAPLLRIREVWRPNLGYPPLKYDAV